MSAVLDRPAKRRRAAEEPPAHLYDTLLGKHWRSLEWRLNNLYWIVDENGKKIPFRMNEEQTDFIRNLHTRNLILKARQLGFSTLCQVLHADQAMFNANHTGVTIADTIPNAGKLFAKVELAVDRAPEALREALPIKSRTAKTSIEWEHGSSVYVSTAPRGGTVQLLHVSELGRISRKAPLKAEEIVSGGFEAVSKDNIIIVESTAEGSAGEFYELAAPAIKRAKEGTPDTALDWRLHFYPWWKKAAYRLSDADTKLVVISDRMRIYFDKMQLECGTKFDANQRAWYVKKQETLGRKMKREHPATPEEAFEQAAEGAVFGEEMTGVRENGRITVVPLDVNYPVNTFWDFGLGARNPIWLHQRIGLQNRWVKYFDDFGKGLGWWWRHLEDWRIAHGSFAWGTHFLPHDADAEILGESVTTKHRILEEAGMNNIEVVARVADKMTAIDLMRVKLPADNWFDRMECAEGIKAIDNYQFEWNDKMQRYGNEPMKNWAAHGTDAWMQYAQADDAGLISGPGTAKADRSMRNFMNRPRRGF